MPGNAAERSILMSKVLGPASLQTAAIEQLHAIRVGKLRGTYL